jgi:MYXO-CTERM domain-containing protein
MNGFAKMIGWSLLVGVTCLFSAAGARAATSCVNDKDCTATPQCGGEVCDWNRAPNMTCKAAGGDAQGSDGWCTVDTDCKCYADGARCVGSYCTFTKPPTGGGGTTGSAGTTGSGGSTGAAGTTGSAGSTGTAGTTGSAGSGTNDSGGGCRVAESPATGGALAGVALGLTLAFARRRRRR